MADDRLPRDRTPRRGGYGGFGLWWIILLIIIVAFIVWGGGGRWGWNRQPVASHNNLPQVEPRAAPHLLIRALRDRPNEVAMADVKPLGLLCCRASLLQNRFSTP
jgi:hypothetical protein